MLSIARNLSRPAIGQNARHMMTSPILQNSSGIIIAKVSYVSCALGIFLGSCSLDGAKQVRSKKDEFIEKYVNGLDGSEFIGIPYEEITAKITEKMNEEIGWGQTIETFVKGSVTNLEYNVGRAAIFPIATLRGRLFD